MTDDHSTSAALDQDTIAAIATAPGHGGVGIVRVSGPAATHIAQQICKANLEPRSAHLCKFTNADNEVLDQGIALFFPGPNSFTGEDVLELQAHGGPVVLDLIQQECCRLGARPARPGEFSERAFLNNKIDLTQAEAIADLINSTTVAAVRSANRSLQGAFSQEVNELVKQVTQLRVFVEAAIDFPEEEIDFIADGQVLAQLKAIIEQHQAVLKSATQGSLLQDGMKLVIVGKPNAGKSSLLNQLSGQDSAIVTAIEGTTRDVLREQIQIDGMPLHIVDTAGLRENAETVEQEGIRRAWKEMESADHILVLVDASVNNEDASDETSLLEEINNTLAHIPALTIVNNKCDLSNIEPQVVTDRAPTKIYLSAKTGAGIDLLRSHLKAAMGYQTVENSPFSARRRHLDALNLAMDSLQLGKQQLENLGAGELLAEDLRQCQNHLGTITGVVTSDDLLGEIFSSFCIGK